MAYANGSSTMIKNPGVFQAPGALLAGFYAACAVGVGAFVYGFRTDPARVWAAFIHNHFYFMSFAVGGLLFAAIQYATRSMWSAPVRRLGEALTAYLPVTLVACAILYFGMHEAYVWTHSDHVQGDAVLSGKIAYLNVGFFLARGIGITAIWILFARLLVGNSLKQDKTGEFALTLRNQRIAPAFLILFAVTYSVMSFDELMSLDPHWFSTIFGVYCFSGLFYSTLAMICMMTVALKWRGLLDGIVNDNHLHDLGKLMFAFTVFWAYIGFSQFMLIWYANLPEETGYFLKRMSNGWMAISVFLLVGKFLAPFLILLPRAAKRCEKTLFGVGAFMLIAQWIDVLWLVQPEFHATGPKVGIPEIGLFLGFGGLFGIFVTRFLSRNPIVAIRDPRLAEAVHHHHQ